MGHKWLDDEGHDWSLAAAHLNLKISGSQERKSTHVACQEKPFFTQAAAIPSTHQKSTKSLFQQ